MVGIAGANQLDGRPNSTVEAGCRRTTLILFLGNWKIGLQTRQLILILQILDFAASHSVAHLVQSIRLEYGAHGSRVGQVQVRVSP